MEPVRLALAGVFLTFFVQGQSAPELDEPFRIMAGDEPISVDMGYAAPCYTDFDGDGIRDLLVGQFSEGKLRIYRNNGTDTQPEFSDFFYFQAAGADGTVPVG